MLEMSRHICRRQKCRDNCRGRGPLDTLMENSNNALPPEVLCKILGYLPQKEMVGNRSVCKFWRDTIDQHCTVKEQVEFRREDEFLYRKLQLKIRECVINWLPPGNSRNIKFAYPQSIKSITLNTAGDCWRNVRRLLNQVKPYVHIMDIRNRYLENNIFTPPYVFPMVRELTIMSQFLVQELQPSTLPVNLDVLFSHRMPSLKILHLRFFDCDLHVADEMHKKLLTFLSMHGQSIKHLDVTFSTKGDAPEFPETFELPTEMESLLCNGQLQLEYLDLRLPRPSRYLSAWTPILNRQNNLIDLKVCDGDDNWRGGGSSGIPFNAISPGIQSSFATLRILHLDYILSVDQDGRTWIPLDCIVLRGAANLTELSLGSNLEVDDVIHMLDDFEGVPLINLGEIPLECLKKLAITVFVCDSGELQTLVDNSPLLEDLGLYCTQAFSDTPRFASTGVLGGTIRSFLDKPNKKRIEVIGCINYSNQEENEKLEAVQLLYPPQSHELIGNFYRNFE